MGRAGQDLELEAGALRLRPLAPADAADLQRVLDDPAVGRWTPHPWPYRLEDAERRLAGADAAWESGARRELAVLEDGVLVGTVGLYAVAGTTAATGWATASWARGRGLTVPAVTALCRWAHADLGLTRLTAVVEVGNSASLRVGQRAGFGLEGVARGLLPPVDGAPGDAWQLARLADDPYDDTAAFPPYDGPSDGVVRLRRWRPEDAAVVARACDDPETARWLPVPVPYEVADARGWLDLVERAWASGERADVAVVDAATGEVLGAVGLSTGRAGVGEVGYWVAPWARGRGVATRAARLHTDWALGVLGLARVELLADVEHTVSQQVAERAGFVREGVARAARPEPRGTARRDMVVLSRTA